jgi:predicted anti-sigma-YlaC factor YlaD
MNSRRTLDGEEIPEMKCHTVYRFICEHLDKDSDNPKFRAVRKHLQKCPPCVKFLASLKKTVELYCAEPPVEVPKTVHRDLMRALKAEREK